MQKIGQFVLMIPSEFRTWLMNKPQYRDITSIQHHHTYKPDISDFTGKNHFSLLQGMHDYHVNVRKFTDIAQNITIFPDGTVAICRDFEITPAGIKGHNAGAICIENLGNFDKEVMPDAMKQAVVDVTAALCERFEVESDHVVYHCWYDAEGKPAPPAVPCKTCPGVLFMGGNTREAFEENFLPLIYSK